MGSGLVTPAGGGPPRGSQSRLNACEMANSTRMKERSAEFSLEMRNSSLGAQPPDKWRGLTTRVALFGHKYLSLIRHTDILFEHLLVSAERVY